METIDVNGEPITRYTVSEFIKATRPDGLGHIELDGKKIASFPEVLCDFCNAEIT